MKDTNVRFSAWPFVEDLRNVHLYSELPRCTVLKDNELKPVSGKSCFCLIPGCDLKELLGKAPYCVIIDVGALDTGPRGKADRCFELQEMVV